MVTISVKGHEFNAFNVSGASPRRAIQFRNDIIANLKKLGVDEDDVNIPLEQVVIRRVPASVSWYLDGQHLYFSHKLSNFIQNLYVVSKVIELEVKALLNHQKTREEFILDFSEDEDVESKRQEAREMLGVGKDSLDLDEINKKYKVLAKEHHPDAGGSTEKFKTINNAHKILKRELQ
ncbi:MAG: J domain-containing protein [Nanoarchaeota archaeon]|nr:J domain-containing protein [Nanoarchaeota archaeon]MBU1644381.1 J domain-containing protein [Nanoarchaeota archaeon]MBU1976432.1 J domain-containing protein [Nanoarchaeota archaeon]